MEESLENALPLWMAAFLLLLYPWSAWQGRRLNKALSLVGTDSSMVHLQKDYKRLHFLLLIACVIVLLFAYLPAYYRYALPIDPLDHPFINNTGLVVLRFALFWLLVAQLKIEGALRKGLALHRPDPVFFQQLRARSIRLLSEGIVLILVGLFVTISSLATVALSLLALRLYQKHFRLTPP